MDHVRKQCEAAHAVGLRWCIYGSHCVTAAACTSAGNILHTSCLPCLERRHHAHTAHAPAAAIDHVAKQDPIDDRDGVLTEPIVEDEFGDDTHWMDIDLPDDSTVSTREKTLLLNMH